MPNRTVLVTGGTRGIGRACVDRFLEHGDQVAILSRSGHAVEGAISIACDVTQTDEIRRSIGLVRNEVGAIDILVANAGGASVPMPALVMSEQQILDDIDLNLLAAVRLTRAVAKDMWRGSWGRLIFLGSVAGELGCAGAAGYSAAKGGLESLCRSLALELGSRGITVNVVAPGAIETESVAGHEIVSADWVSSTAMGRRGLASEVANLVAFLSSDDASYITGTVIPIDGGLRLGVGIAAGAIGEPRSQAESVWSDSGP